MADFEDKMVLRTVYLPFDLDQELKSIAFRDDRSKNDLIRELVKLGMQTAKTNGDKRFKTVVRSGKPIVAQRVQPRPIGKAAAAKAGSDAPRVVSKAELDAAKGKAAKKATGGAAGGGRKAAAA